MNKHDITFVPSTRRVTVIFKQNFIASPTTKPLRGDSLRIVLELPSGFEHVILGLVIQRPNLTLIKTPNYLFSIWILNLSCTFVARLLTVSFWLILRMVSLFLIRKVYRNSLLFFIIECCLQKIFAKDLLFQRFYDKLINVKKGEGNLIFCCMGSRETYIGSVGLENNNNNPKFQGRHI